MKAIDKITSVSQSNGRSDVEQCFITQRLRDDLDCILIFNILTGIILSIYGIFIINNADKITVNLHELVFTFVIFICIAGGVMCANIIILHNDGLSNAKQYTPDIQHVRDDLFSIMLFNILMGIIFIVFNVFIFNSTDKITNNPEGIIVIFVSLGCMAGGAICFTIIQAICARSRINK